ncbi:hypothetical protein Q5P01_010519 [Channa striata]|uniref:Uncharacterized protein n=1 Tax=Channa striata TaxID=64152 RepID=A0AA88N281_CHASR|nr:hypothetical protein Q5P01_010519 [Channa striata]
MSFLPPSPALMNQAPLIADFTLSGPIVGPYRRGSDSSGQTLGEEGGREGVGSISTGRTPTSASHSPGVFLLELTAAGLEKTNPDATWSYKRKPDERGQTSGSSRAEKLNETSD